MSYAEYSNHWLILLVFYFSTILPLSSCSRELIFREFERSEENNQWHIHYIIMNGSLNYSQSLFLLLIHGRVHISPNDGLYLANTSLFLYLTKSIFYPYKTLYAFSRSKYRSKRVLNITKTPKLAKEFMNDLQYSDYLNCTDSCLQTCCGPNCVYSTCICAQHKFNR